MAKLIYGNGSNSFYATKIDVSDPYLWVQEDDGKTHVLLNDLELGAAKRSAQVDHIHPLRKYVDRLLAMGETYSASKVIALFCEELDLKEVIVPSEFPSALLCQLEEEGLGVYPEEGLFFPERLIKTAEEIAYIEEAQNINAQAIMRGFEVLRDSMVNGDKTLDYNYEPLTSERLQGLINARAAELGATHFNAGPIVAGGVLGADPHERGVGVLRAEELIIIDSFPKHRNGYNGDLTRTVVKGDAAETHHALFDAVLKAQEAALEKISPKVTGAEVHAEVVKTFESSGFETGVNENGEAYGFFHSTGHDLGVDVHDVGLGLTPRNTEKLDVGRVLTVEPGLYYPGQGGVRIEDIVTVTEDGYKNLTDLPKFLEVDQL